MAAFARQVRIDQGLALRAVARSVPCSPSFLSAVELGQRRLTPSFARRLDEIYRSDRSIASLLVRDVILVHLPDGIVAVDRRELLTGLALGVASGVLADIQVIPDILGRLTSTFDGFLDASRFTTSPELKDSLTGQVAYIDALRHKAETARLRRGLLMLLARHAELLSWLHEESYDLKQALFWIDRTAGWADTAGWPEMVAFTFHRRSQMALNYSDDGTHVVRLATDAINHPGADASLRGTASTWLSLGYALIGDRDSSDRAADESLAYLSVASTNPQTPVSFIESTTRSDLVAMRRAHAQILMGQGHEPISILEARLPEIASGSTRRLNTNRARLALAYANAGDVEGAVRIIDETTRTVEALPSVWARRELHRAKAVLLRRWPNRPDVKEITSRAGI
ncbi:helix-turn-helix domain-containing protein [Pseudofrankia inefficax]|uniref:Putative DNA-binding protein n=1 Tax=Pseudofrankia inefficax (strain DSM 45817 / CECT 9037 / DDB 130130 / EuI1c) TaxID=298654 RepID=E3J8T8_PSEI1|nr:helix-turn-helix domain-containing protein [Pseudofrankia inefficax]ADP79671.1 putative DNA-binding protein [Pseudofrankia inefficax]